MRPVWRNSLGRTAFYIPPGGALEAKKVISEEKGFDAATLTEEDVETYGLGE